MSVTYVTGGQITVKVAATAYTGQITGGSITQNGENFHIKTLSDAVDGSTGTNSAVSLSYIYDTETGMHGALETAIAGKVPVAVEIVAGDAKWSGNMLVDSATVDFTAEGTPATGSVTFSSSTALAFADAP